jgi:DNA-directed RNA polymerase specialized sigma24 family protein
MNKTDQISKEDFEALLNWFSTNKEEAGKEYEQIRDRLVNFFCFKGCADSQNLADETINRVTLKLTKLNLTQTENKISIFYGFAQNVYHEYRRQVSKQEIQLITELPLANLQTENNQTEDSQFRCLDLCLKKLSASERKLILTYYSKEKNEKINLRKKIASSYGITLNALHVRVYRLKDKLRNCLEECENKSEM